jgi:hypothetical protein
MTDAINNPVKRKYTRKEIHTGEHQVPDQIVNVDTMERGIAIAQEIPDVNVKEEYEAQLKFNEEPVTIRIEPNPRADYPETHAPCAANGRGAEMWINGKWVSTSASGGDGWLPIGQVVTTKRKYVEVLARCGEHVFKPHEVTETPRPMQDGWTTIKKHTRPYPFTVLRDDNPKGHEWLTRILSGQE